MRYQLLRRLGFPITPPCLSVAMFVNVAFYHIDEDVEMLVCFRYLSFRVRLRFGEFSLPKRQLSDPPDHSCHSVRQATEFSRHRLVSTSWISFDG